MKRIISVVAIIITTLAIVYSANIEVDAKGGDTWICEEYQGYIYEISDMYGICPEIIMAIVEHESSGQSNARNGACKGLMQINDSYTSQKVRMKELGVVDIYEPYSNILVGVDYIMDLADEYQDIAGVLMHYHGEYNVESKLDSGRLSSYANEILTRSAELEMIHYGT